MVRFRRSSCDTWQCCTGSVVTELAEHQGVEHCTESWPGAVDVGIGVILKMGGQGCFEFGDLSVERCDDMDCSGRGRS